MSQKWKAGLRGALEF